MFYEIRYYFQYYIDNYPFLIPLGFIGLWRWGVWAFKEIVARQYKPTQKTYNTKVSIVTPVYNENPIIFASALESWLENNPQEIIAVIDYTDTACIDAFKNFTQKHPDIAKLFITRIPGKREALALGIQHSTNDIVALVDSDTLWKKDTLKNGVSPFYKKQIAGVATYQNVLNPKTIAQRIFDTQLDLRYSDDYAFLAAAGDALVCLSGRTAFYRRNVITPLLPDLVNETFMGEKVISGDDKRLTYLLLEKGYKVAFQNNSRVFTPGMSDLSSYMKQRLRWTRNSLRADLRAIKQGWPFKHKALVFFQFDKVAQGIAVILSPIFFFISLFEQLWIPAIFISFWWILGRTIKMYPHLKRRPQDIAVLPAFILYTFLTGVIKVYALFTLRTQGWITRWDSKRLSRLTFLQKAPAYAATALFFFVIIQAVYLYKYHMYLIPQQQQQALLTTTLPISTTILEKNIQEDTNNILQKRKDLLTRRHVVRDGETLSTIAQEYGIDQNTLLTANISRLTNWNIIEPGFVLTIPGKDQIFTGNSTFNYQRIYPDVLRSAYDEASNTINVYGRGKTITLSDIQEDAPEHVKNLGNGQWYITANIFLHSGVSLDLARKEVPWLKLESNPNRFVHIIGYNATITIDGVKITSWDETKNDVDKDVLDGRSYILARDGTRMDIYNSELAYLGYSRTLPEEASVYGVSWKMSNGKLGTVLLTGDVTNSKFHDNYFGAYTFGATGMLWKDNEFFNNIRYGLDPHDDSNGFLIEHNIAHDNGTHGIILSKRCVENTIRNNISYNNKLHGIMLHEKSDRNLVENNILTNNAADGISLWHSSDNVIRNNVVSNNKRGIRINQEANNNYVLSNKISDTKQYGIYLYNKAESNILTNNTVQDGNAAIYIKTSKNIVSQNTIKNNRSGIYLYTDAADNMLTKNIVRYNTHYGLYTEVIKGAKNYIQNNTLDKNRLNIFAREYQGLTK